MYVSLEQPKQMLKEQLYLLKNRVEIKVQDPTENECVTEIA